MKSHRTPKGTHQSRVKHTPLSHDEYMSMLALAAAEDSTSFLVEALENFKYEARTLGDKKKEEVLHSRVLQAVAAKGGMPLTVFF